MLLLSANETRLLRMELGILFINDIEIVVNIKTTPFFNFTTYLVAEVMPEV